MNSKNVCNGNILIMISKTGVNRYTSINSVLKVTSVNFKPDHKKSIKI
ncbi:MAG: hypothetical protein A4E26_01251 [Methanobacterium sp. PtaU1.Bin097]|jgi:hypothetical protein|nr:MAG: hypothetical protein A4E26_01251 [Methanobacterium sp. PtaU1.Bin097]